MKKTALVGAASLAACLLVSVAARADDFDGNWAVHLITESGACDHSVNTTVGVTGGRIMDAGLIVTTNGSVDGHGHVALRVAGAGHIVAASGVLASRGGSGTWNSPSHQCSGHWVASRQG